MTNTQVPVFSLLDLANGRNQDEFRTCLKDIGVFYIKDYGVSDAEHQRVRTKIMEFFEHGSEEEKAAVTSKVPAVRRGYLKLEAESTAKVTNAGQYSDYAIAYSMGIKDNLFPSPEFESILTPYFKSYYSAAQRVASEVLKTMGVDYNGRVDSFLDCDPLLRFRHYPDVPESRCAEYQPLRVAAHYDISIVTMIHQTPCPNGFVSLQCEAGGEYVDLPYIPDACVVQCGAILAIVSDGKTKAPKHQVSAPPSKLRVGSNRSANIFFLRPKPEFTFSVPLAKACGFDVSLTGETATFQEWVSGNYANMHEK
jgi:deacetoxycephalosporin-C synthase/deacetoxycephalosporin-C hydroxylase